MLSNNIILIFFKIAISAATNFKKTWNLCFVSVLISWRVTHKKILFFYVKWNYLDFKNRLIELWFIFAFAKRAMFHCDVINFINAVDIVIVLKSIL